MPNTFTATLILQLPNPPLLKMATSAAPGTDAPGAPPEVADQLAVLFQTPAPAATQYLSALLTI